MSDAGPLRSTLETSRFVLKSMNIWEAMAVTDSWRHDAEILTGLFQSPKPKSRIAWYIEGPIPRSARRFAYSITPKGATRPIGAHAIRLSGYRSAYCSVALHDREWWGKNVVVEVRAALMSRFFRHGGVERFYGLVEGRNTASIFSYRRLGYTHTGTWHRHRQNPVTGEVIDYVCFEIFRDQWQAGAFGESVDGH